MPIIRMRWSLTCAPPASSNTAWQRFLPTGPLALLPLPDGRSSIVWSVARGRSANVCARSMPRAICRRARDGERRGARRHRAHDAGRELSAPAAICARLRAAARRVARRRRARGASVGRAGAQSGVIGLRIARRSARRGGRRRSGDCGSLRRYERWRKSENLIAAAALDGLERLFSSSNPGIARCVPRDSMQSAVFLSSSASSRSVPWGWPGTCRPS